MCQPFIDNVRPLLGMTSGVFEVVGPIRLRGERDRGGGGGGDIIAVEHSVVIACQVEKVWNLESCQRVYLWNLESCRRGYLWNLESCQRGYLTYCVDEEYFEVLDFNSHIT